MPGKTIENACSIVSNVIANMISPHQRSLNNIVMRSNQTHRP